MPRRTVRYEPDAYGCWESLDDKRELSRDKKFTDDARLNPEFTACLAGPELRRKARRRIAASLTGVESMLGLRPL